MAVLFHRIKYIAVRVCKAIETASAGKQRIVVIIIAKQSRGPEWVEQTAGQVVGAKIAQTVQSRIVIIQTEHTLVIILQVADFCALKVQFSLQEARVEQFLSLGELGSRLHSLTKRGLLLPSILYGSRFLLLPLLLERFKLHLFAFDGLTKSKFTLIASHFVFEAYVLFKIFKPLELLALFLLLHLNFKRAEVLLALHLPAARLEIV